jgi:putative DNA methylase
MPDTDRPRLIEVAFPLKQAPLDSVHEKNVRDGRVSSLHNMAKAPAPREAYFAEQLLQPKGPGAR